MEKIDARYASPTKAWLRALELTARIRQNTETTLPLVVQGLAERFGANPALRSNNQSFTYRELAARSNQYARWAIAHNIGPGDVVCLLMPNCPEYMAIWLGVTRARGIVSLLNTNLTGDSLAHAIKVARPRHIVVGADLAGALVDVIPRLAPHIQYWICGESGFDFTRIESDLRNYCGIPLDSGEAALPSIFDPALYIYTSGTTGLPKAANVSHYKIMQWCYWFAGLIGTRSDDILYNCLPMYHSVGGVVATGAVLVGGGSVEIRQRFSASRFWNEVIESRCTLFQYIGELCRYLVNSPNHPRETQHRLRLCCGNGLGREVWSRFQERFRIPRILEFYAATEGSFSLYNCEGKRGAIGRIPPFLAHRIPVALVKFDTDSGEPVRNDLGFCVRCPTGEPGEAIGKIVADLGSAGGRFEGYADQDESEKKVLRNVFEPGDAWYRTGDLMCRDESGYYYFVDRVGDTFRWKGENVSTAEVAEIIGAFPGVVEAAVYGVAVANNEGRAGMAAIVIDAGFDPGSLHAHLSSSLPEYARPLFLRICNQIATTGTFKPNKQKLMSEGFDPSAVEDELYFDDRARDAFVVLDADLHTKIANGSVRL